MKSRNDSLSLLQKLIRQKSREKRYTECLKDPERAHEDKDEWFMYVPSCFNDCLDIAKTDRVVKTDDSGPKKKTKKVWTQGSRFSFHRGCTLYDTPKAYHRWGDAINEIRYCVSIYRGENAEPAARDNDRKSGTVEFTVLSPSKRAASFEEIGTFKLTQDEFIGFLIDGNPQIISI